MITITYFGRLKDLCPSGCETLGWPGGSTEDLLNQLRQRGPEWHAALQPEQVFRIAVNHHLLNEPKQLEDGDEIAILPPVTGG